MDNKNQKIIPNLWFNKNAEEAVNFYTSTFKNSSIGATQRYDEESSKVAQMPAGSVLTIEYTLEGIGFVALNGGPAFEFTPAVSFMVSCDSEDEVEELYNKLSEGGSVLMPLDKYPFSDKYAWISDKYGVSWQLMKGESKQKISPCLLFVGDKNGKAQEAINMYVSLFENSNVDTVSHYEEGNPHNTTDHLNFASFNLDGFNFVAMDSGLDHKFTFSQATSFIINCKDQAEVDKFHNKLSEGGEVQPCGWLLDKYGVAWQVTPTILVEMLADPDPEKASRVMKAMLKMEKIIIADLEKAYNNE